MPGLECTTSLKKLQVIWASLCWKSLRFMSHRIIQVGKDHRVWFNLLLKMKSAMRSSQVIQGFIQSEIQELQGRRLHNLSLGNIFYLLGFLWWRSFVFSCIFSCVVLFLILCLRYHEDCFKITIYFELSPFKGQRLRSPFGSISPTSFVLSVTGIFHEKWKWL